MIKPERIKKNVHTNRAEAETILASAEQNGSLIISVVDDDNPCRESPEILQW